MNSLLAYSQILNIPFEVKNGNKKIMHRYLQTWPKSLDPGEVYDSQNIFLLGQVYEQLYGYQENQLIPLLAEHFPKISFLNHSKQHVLASDIENIAYTVYTIPIRKHIFYQPHPALHQLRELVADDFVYTFKRAAFDYVNSPIVNLLSQHVLGYDDFLKNPQENASIEGVQALDSYTLQIITKKHYEQFVNWLAMSLFAPVPPEVDAYNKTFGDKDSWRWTTIGTGPFMILDDKNYQKIHMQKNPNYREQYLHLNGKNLKLPMIDELIFYLEKESIPRWNKFLQGYYDYSSIPSETYEKIVWAGPDGKTQLSPQLADKNIQMNYVENYDISGIAFNMKDQILGQNLNLRRAISIGFQFLDYINIFQNAYVDQAQGPLPPLLIKSNHVNGFNPYIFNHYRSQSVRKSINEARSLLTKAGYPNGIDPKTGKSLILILDVESTGKPSERAIFNWYRKQMNLLGIQLQVREDDKNHYHRLISSGDFQMTPFAWGADYPDAENFFMLFYGPNGKTTYQGLNVSNYQNDKFDQLFERYSQTTNPLKKQEITQKLYEILIHDAVWVWGTHSQNLFLSYQWVDLKAQNSAYFTGISKYFDLHPNMRLNAWKRYNQAKWHSLLWVGILLFVVFLPFIREWRNMNKRPVKRTLF